MEAFLEPQQTADHRLESGAPTRLENLLEGLRDRTGALAAPDPGSGRFDEVTANGPLSVIDPGDDVVRVDLQGTGGLRVLIIHRLAHEYAFLDTGHVTYPLNTHDRDELLLALEELKAMQSRRLERD